MGNSWRLWLWVGLAPVLLVMALGIRDFGAALWQQSKLDDAAFEGVAWGKSHANDAAGIATAAQSATGLSGITVTPYSPCGCTTSGGIELARCDAACPGGGISQPYIVVTASRCYGTAFSWPGVSYCASGNSQCAAAGCASNQVVLSSQSLASQ